VVELFSQVPTGISVVKNRPGGFAGGGGTAFGVQFSRKKMEGGQEEKVLRCCAAEAISCSSSSLGVTGKVDCNRGFTAFSFGETEHSSSSIGKSGRNMILQLVGKLAFIFLTVVASDILLAL
jgi:hypothetical protein